MIKIPYVLNYSLFEKIDLTVAEELLSEYNDFMGFNKTQIQNLAKTACAFAESQEQEPEEQALGRIEHNKQTALDHFNKLFGNTDIAESTLVGLKIDYDAIQKVLLDEASNKIPITESAFNQIAPIIRASASMLLYAERVVSGLQKLVETAKDKEKCELAIEFAKEGFALLLDGVGKGNLVIPEYHKAKKELNKIKTVDGFVTLCEKLFFENRDY